VCMHYEPSALSEAERYRLTTLIEQHGLHGAARQIGMSRTALASCMLGTAREVSLIALRTRLREKGL